MLLSAVSVLVVAHSSSEIPEGLMNSPVYYDVSVSLVVAIFGENEAVGCGFFT